MILLFLHKAFKDDSGQKLREVLLLRRSSSKSFGMGKVMGKK
jgi:hypothetical protein